MALAKFRKVPNRDGQGRFVVSEGVIRCSQFSCLCEKCGEIKNTYVNDKDDNPSCRDCMTPFDLRKNLTSGTAY